MTYQWKNPFLLILILITLVNEWKAKWVHEGYSQFKKKTPKRPKRSSKSQEDTKVSGHQCRQSVDLHGSKLLISLVPFNLHFHCFQGQEHSYVTIPIVFPSPQAVLPPSVLLFLLRRQLQGSVRVSSMKVSTNQWHHQGQVALAIFDHLWVFEIVSGLNSVEHTNSEEPQTEEEEEFQNREKKKGVMITLILSLLTLFLIFETTQFTKI